MLEEPEAPALLGPVERDVAAHQIGECELGRLGAIDDGTRDVGSEIGQPDQVADIGPRAAVFPSEFVQRLAMLQPPTQVTCPGQRLDERLSLTPPPHSDNDVTRLLTALQDVWQSSVSVAAPPQSSQAGHSAANSLVSHSSDQNPSLSPRANAIP